MSRLAKVSALLILGTFPVACSTVKVPDLVDLPEFRQTDANPENLEFPDPTQAPAVPDDLRTKSDWDKAANTMIKQRDEFTAPKDVDGIRTDQDIKKDIEALKNKVKEYKLDDPVGE